MSTKVKSNAALYWVIGVVFVAMCAFVYFFVSDAPKTLPKITLSYFVSEQEIAESIGKRLFLEIKANANYWIGLEPDKAEQLGVVLKLKDELEKNSPFQKVIVDQELGLKPEFLVQIKATDVVSFKENLYGVGQQLQDFENKKINYLFITASIYSTSLLQKNPIHSLKEKYQLKPMTFSLAYFPTSQDDENNMLFKCNTEDHSGVSDWACNIANKSRFSRRKIQSANVKPWIGLMDLSSENDYILLLKKK